MSSSLVLKWLLFMVLAAMPIVGHGCHREDVDDEPGFFPRHRMGEQVSP